MFICDDCGSANVQMQMWANPNTGEIDVDLQPDLKDCWCEDCEAHVSLTTQAQPETPAIGQ